VTETLDIVCPACGRTLRIGAEHAGKQVRCPACQQISAAPGAVTSASIAEPQTSASDDDARWHVRTPEGTVFGPIRWSELLTWVSEGRVAADCELAASSEGPWQPAGVVLPVLRMPAGNPTAATMTAPASGTGPSPFVSLGGSSVTSSSAGMFTPHRGGLVLVFGVLGIVMGCPVFSAIAWILGSRDLREIRQGRMDRQGEGITLVGMILGMIVSLLWLVFGFIGLSIALVAIAAQF
jgi:hypothetical protein